ncbi:LD-carboxypeptidase [Romboutsia ilealis]|uniref:LD-carboxypeptidase n=1 Tax=Romboutsia faecis TaxID=2764597 RepID=A0ABR7JMY8_9FIRM|nr:LD-carboxypeptidase [Romboutsia faecis]MBC5996304.1 LD-carboxypeptidase [Romboutsia faecis]MRN25054.1 LD-carboxypeptidase [Romboutsia ilealis]
MNRPKCLKQGDTIGIIAPAGDLREYTIEGIKSSIESYGYKVKIGRSCYLNYRGYLAGQDEMRVLDLENMFLDDRVDAIMCLRGGYGSSRILDMIDYDIIKTHPKIFIGFSDITALHIAFNQKCNLITYHGIMANKASLWDESSYYSLLEALNFKGEYWVTNPDNIPIYTLYKGNATGQIIGGNLSMITSTLGTEYEIDTKDKILFIEEVGEYIYRIDRLLKHLELANKFRDCKGIIFGDFADCRKSTEKDCDLIELLKEIANKYKKPTVYNLKSGHCTPMVTIPLGVQCTIKSGQSIIKFNN